MPDYRLLYDEARSQLDQQLAAIDGLDAKVGLFFSVSSGLLAIIAFILATSVVRTSPWVWGVLAFLSGATYFAVVVAAIYTLWGDNWAVGADVLQLGDAYGSGSESTATLIAAKTLLSKWEGNKPYLAKKLTAMRWALGATLGLTVLAVVAAVAAFAVALSQPPLPGS